MSRSAGRHAALDGQTKHGHDAIHGLVLPAHRAAAVRRVVPEARAGRVQPRTVLLHDRARHCNTDTNVRSNAHVRGKQIYRATYFLRQKIERKFHEPDFSYSQTAAQVLLGAQKFII